MRFIANVLTVLGMLLLFGSYFVEDRAMREQMFDTFFASTMLASIISLEICINQLEKEVDE
jgi:hypothetical protein